MDPKKYEVLTRVNYDCANGIVTRNTVAFDFANYHAALARLHQFFLHDWGVASGLEVGGTVGAANLQVKPGVAIDRKGQLIVLSTGGSGLLGQAQPGLNQPATVPVTLPTAGLGAQQYLLTVQYFELPQSDGSHPDFICGEDSVAPWLRLQPVAGFTDSDDFVCLAVVDLDASGFVKSVKARDAAAPLSRRRLGETVGAVRFEAPTDGNPAGSVQEVAAAAVEALPAGAGLQITSALTALTGKLCIAPTGGTLPPDVPGSLVVLSSIAPGGGGGVKTLDANGKVMAALTTSGAGGTQAGYVSVGTAAGVEIVSLSASASGAGQVQVQTHGGKAAVILNTAGPADDGFVHVLSNAQDVITLGPTGITSRGGITSTQGGVTAQGVIATSQGLAAPWGVWCGGPGWGQGTASGNVWCGSVFGQGWSAGGGGFTGPSFWGQGCNLTRGQMQVFNGSNHETALVSTTTAADGYFHTKGDGGRILIQLSTTSSTHNGWLGVFNQAGNVVANLFGGTDSNGYLNVCNSAGAATCWMNGSNGQIGANDWIFSSGGLQVNKPGYTAGYMSGGSDGGYLTLQNKGGKPVVQLTTATNGVGIVLVTDANGHEVHRFDGGGAKNFVMPHPGDESKDIVYACIEGPEAAAYVRGRATLTGGRAQVQLPDHFSLVVNQDTMTVQLTPRSAASKGLAVVGSGPGTISVQELSGGTGDYEFDYFVAGVRKGYEDYQAVVAKGFSPMGHQVSAAAAPAAPPPSSAPPAAAPVMASGAPPAPPSAPAAAAPGEPGNKPAPWDLL
jgi:hypothetical protein